MAAKISKTDAGYGPGMPHCGACAHYIDDDDEDGTESESGTCELVSGVIGEDMWCKLYSAKRRPSLAEGAADNG
jgi:hypothetical protein